MKAFIVKLIVPVALLALAAPAWAGGLDRIGTAGAQELRIPVGAAPLALAGSSVALGGGLANIFWNPASLASTENSEAMVSYSTYLADMQVNYGAISMGVGAAGNLAIALKVLNIGDITVTTEDAPGGTGEILTPNFSILGVSYARRMTDRVLLGVTANYINEKVAEVRATGFGVDLGVQYDTGWRGLRFGFAMKNVGPSMQYEGAGFEQRIVLPGDDPAAQPHVVRLESTDFELPSYLQLGLAYDISVAENQHVTVTGAFQGNNFSTDEYRLGAEYILGGRLAVRGGFQGQFPLQQEDRQPEYLYNLSYGAGLNFRLGDTPLNFDWAGTSVGQFFEDNQQFSLTIAF